MAAGVGQAFIERVGIFVALLTGGEERAVLADKSVFLVTLGTGCADIEVTSLIASEVGVRGLAEYRYVAGLAEERLLV